LKAEESLQEIARISQTAAALAADISQAAQKQVDGAESAAGTVQTIAGRALQSEKGVLQSRQTIDELSRLAEDLTAKLSRFKLAA
jgi:methyl-accepting chemotaxis protein